MFQSEKHRERRRGYAIRAYVGANGGGKSACAVFDLLPSLDAGRPVLSTARLLDFRNPRPCDDLECVWPGHPDHPAAHPYWFPFNDWRQLLDFRNGDVLLDEVAGVASSRESGSLPFQVARELQKLRKRDVTLSYTGPSFARCEKIIRECTLLLTYCQGRRPQRIRSEDGSSRAWVQHRMLKWDSFDAQAFERFASSDGRLDDGGERKIKRLFGQMFSLAGSPIISAYDSLDAVMSLGWANESGMCMECGGNRPRPRCVCGDVRARRSSGASGDGADDAARAERQASGAPDLIGADGGLRVVPAH